MACREIRWRVYKVVDEPTGHQLHLCAALWLHENLDDEHTHLERFVADQAAEHGSGTYVAYPGHTLLEFTATVPRPEVQLEREGERYHQRSVAPLPF